MILEMITRHPKEVHIYQEFWWEPGPQEEWLQTLSFLTIHSLRMPNPCSCLLVPVFPLAILGYIVKFKDNLGKLISI